jgi:2-dehydro-3-deoxygluconokinase
MAYDAADRAVHHGPVFRGLAVEDRIGSGDGFASGLIFSLLRGDTVAEAVRIGTAHGALLHTTRGDTSQSTVAEVERLLAGATARIDR